jgi:hypothetical protein
VRLYVMQAGRSVVTQVETAERLPEQQNCPAEFGLRLHVIVEPLRWNSYHLTSTMRELTADPTREIGRFPAWNWSTQGFGRYSKGRRTGRSDDQRFSPGEKRDIATDEAWLVTREWKT